MGVPVSSFNDFRKKLLHVKGKSIIFGFLLFDSRPSQDIVNEFTQKQAPWIDELAKHAGIYFFFPFKSEGKKFSNPSTKITKIFNLSLTRLPGIVLFAPPNKTAAKNHAVYIPLKEQDFNDARIYEPIFIDLFELIRESIRKNQTADKALQQIKKELATLRKKERRRGFAEYIRKGAHLVFIDIPNVITVNFAEGIGRGMADKALGP